MLYFCGVKNQSNNLKFRKMKTIEEARKEKNPYKVTESIGNCLSFNNGFNAGVEFAQQWISVEDELPKETRHEFSEWVLTKCNRNIMKLEKYDYQSKCFTDTRYDIEKKGDGQVTHWRPIERK